MAGRGIEFNPDLRAAERSVRVERIAPEDHRCQAAAGCMRWGSIGFRAPGWAGLRQEPRWFCTEHVLEGART